MTKTISINMILNNKIIMLKEIEEEKKRAHHLLHVSLKYTKTGDVILNLIEHWKKLIELCIEELLKKAKKSKAIKEIPTAPKARELMIREIYKDELITRVMDVYSFFRKLPFLEKVAEHEFRKNVALRVIDNEKETLLNIEKLKELDLLICKDFIDYLRHIK